MSSLYRQRIRFPAIEMKSCTTKTSVLHTCSLTTKKIIGRNGKAVEQKTRCNALRYGLKSLNYHTCSLTTRKDYTVGRNGKAVEQKTRCKALRYGLKSLNYQETNL